MKKFSQFVMAAACVFSLANGGIVEGMIAGVPYAQLNTHQHGQMGSLSLRADLAPKNVAQNCRDIDLDAVFQAVGLPGAVNSLHITVNGDCRRRVNLLYTPQGNANATFSIFAAPTPITFISGNRGKKFALVRKDANRTMQLFVKSQGSHTVMSNTL